MSATDPRFFALKDALRVAIVMPLSFALALLIFDSPQMALLASGPMALLVFVEFAGRRPANTRLARAGPPSLEVLAEMEPALVRATLAIGAAEAGAGAGDRQGTRALPGSEGVDRIRDGLVS